MTQQGRTGSRPGRRTLVATTAVALSALLLVGCGAGGDDATVEGEDFDFTGKDVGAMEDYGVGDTPPRSSR